MIEKLRLAKSAHALNDVVAEHNRRMFKEAGITVVNMISSPGSGKTSLLEALARRMHRTLLVITGDIQTQLDKERIEKAGAQAIQIETRGSCHLSAAMINAVVKGLSFSGLELLVIENVGNLLVFAKVVGRRAHEIADVFDHEEFEAGERKPLDDSVYHGGRQVARSPRLDLDCRAPAFSILSLSSWVWMSPVITRSVRCMRRASASRRERLAGAGRADHIDNGDSGLFEHAPVVLRNHVVERMRTFRKPQFFNHPLPRCFPPCNRRPR